MNVKIYLFPLIGLSPALPAVCGLLAQSVSIILIIYRAQERVVTVIIGSFGFYLKLVGFVKLVNEETTNNKLMKSR